MSEVARKLTIRNCGWPKLAIQHALMQKMPDPRNPVDGTTVPLLTVGGFARQGKPGQAPARPGQESMGEYLKLLGDFTAVNLETGEVYSSATCILPNFIAETLGAAVLDPDVREVEFAFKLSAVFDRNSATSYVFKCETIQQSQPSDKMRKMMALLGAPTVAPRLSAPATENGEADPGDDDETDEDVSGSGSVVGQATPAPTPKTMAKAKATA